MGSVEYGECDFCHQDKPLQRKYYHYDIHCDCCNSNEHFEYVSYCNECKPVPPKKITLYMKPIYIKQAVCALIYRGDKVLSVSRKDDPTAFGLIGGKVDEGETPEEALVRETKEETGLDIISYKKIFERFADGIECFTYLCETKGEVSTSEKGVVKEVTWDELFQGPFGEYNLNLYKSLING